MEIVEQIGSYAGLAAIVGLAVLSALYFSQARDVRRLREEGSQRAVGPAPRTPARVGQPQRSPAAAAGQRPAAAAAAQPTAVASGERPPGQRPAAQTAAAGGAAAGAAAAASAPASQKGPEAAAGGASSTAAEKPASAPAKPEGGAPAPAKPADGAGAPPPGARTGPAGAAGDAPGGARGAQGAAGRPTPPQFPSQARPTGRGPGRPGMGAPRGRPQAREPWYRRLEPRFLVLIVAGVLIVGGGAAYGVVALLEEDAPPPAADSGASERKEQTQQAPIDPASVTVAVLNGTSVPGLAAQVGDTIESAGFQRGNVANATDQQAAESVVLYADGQARAARAVGRELDISQIQPIDSESQSLAGDAAVVVIVGADQTQSQ